MTLAMLFTVLAFASAPNATSATLHPCYRDQNGILTCEKAPLYMPRQATPFQLGRVR